ncbi:hypothetical protein D3C80_1937150 [compost metagenome]
MLNARLLEQNACVIHQSADWPQRGLQFSKHRHHFCFFSDIGLQCLRLATLLADLRHHLLSRLTIAQIIDPHRIALLG